MKLLGMELICKECGEPWGNHYCPFQQKVKQAQSVKIALKDLLETVEIAIRAGDWKVDGACDPELSINRARYLIQ